MQGRIEELADKCTEGRLTPEERDEYDALIRVGNFVAILALVRLFHPRQDQWDEHFERNGVVIVGRTAVGRATIGLLKMNATDRRRLRER